jgi:uncharacterized integral membrane protein
VRTEARVAEPTEGDSGWREIPKQGGVSPALIIGGVIAVVLLVFIIQNSNDAEVTWLVTDTTTPLWLVILASAVLGYVVGRLIEIGWRRRRRGND